MAARFSDAVRALVYKSAATHCKAPAGYELRAASNRKASAAALMEVAQRFHNTGEFKTTMEVHTQAPAAAAGELPGYEEVTAKLLDLNSMA